jgi:large subunit ribosomal protein L13
MKTYTPKASEIQRSWHVLDASGKILGRLATEAARLLRGKHKPIYAPHADVGDFVIIVNAAKVRVTGKKAEQKIYYWHTQYPGGLKSVNFAKQLQTHPERVIRHAVKGMLPHNPLGRAMLRRLKVYPGDAHPHQAQLSAQAKKSQERSER